MKAVNVLAVYFLLLMVASAYPQVEADMQLFSQSVATVNNVSAGMINPAGLAPDYILGLRYIHAFPDSSIKGDNGFILGMKGMLFSIQWLKHTNDIFRRKYLLASGMRLFRNFYMGLSYAWFGGTSSEIYYKKNIYKIGLLYRPKPIISLGLVIDNLNRPKFAEKTLERLYTLGVGLRPLGSKFTFSIDGYLHEKDDLGEIESLFRLQIKPVPKIILAADYRTDGFFKVGLAYALNQAETGVSSRFSESDFLGGSFYYNQGPVTRTESIFSDKRIGKVKIDNSLTEEVRARGFFRPRRVPLLRILENIQKATDDPGIVGLFLDIENFPLGFASAQELRSAITKFRASGKKVVAFIDVAGNLEYYIASTADEVYLSPSGYLELKGLKAELIYLAGTLEKIGLYADFVSIGQFKTAPEILTRKTMSEAESLQTSVLLDDLYNQMIFDIATNNGISEEKLKSLIDTGPFSPKSAISAGLVDGLVFKDEILKNSGVYFSRKYNFEELSQKYKYEFFTDYWSEPARIAVVYANGDMVGKHSHDEPFIGRTMGEETIASALRKARTDKDIRAVVLRIDSPGGDVFATDEIYRELKKIKDKKPLVVSVGDVAASGGYYIACIGDDILMMPGAITGSIGIFMGKLVASGLYDKVGANKVILKRGKHADIRTDWRSLNKEEKELVYKQLSEFYDDFISKVAGWRKMPKSRVDSLGQGRVWSGQRAVEIGLADSYGGLLEAIELAAIKADIDPDCPIKLEILPEYKFDILKGYKTKKNNLADVLIGKVPGLILLSYLDESSYFYRLPYEIKIR
ncbi:MAG: signal peptide peptidase SppA [Candidatus Zixiibacteriota bacterium]|nr:MAG: signal peptide peptidase SppA [candidate division Zixibacteria bacterium]